MFKIKSSTVTDSVDVIHFIDKVNKSSWKFIGVKFILILITV